jgi:hypothetical protein
MRKRLRKKLGKKEFAPKSEFIALTKAVFGALDYGSSYQEFTDALKNISPLRISSKANSGKETPLSIGRSGVDEHIPFGQLGMTLQSTLNRAHGFLAQCQAAWILFVIELDDRGAPFPGHTLRPRQHRLDLAQQRPIPVQL